jgi:hypothetical protein
MTDPRMTAPSQPVAATQPSIPAMPEADDSLDEAARNAAAWRARYADRPPSTVPALHISLAALALMLLGLSGVIGGVGGLLSPFSSLDPGTPGGSMTLGPIELVYADSLRGALLLPLGLASIAAGASMASGRRWRLAIACWVGWAIAVFVVNLASESALTSATCLLVAAGATAYAARHGDRPMSRVRAPVMETSHGERPAATADTA